MEKFVYLNSSGYCHDYYRLSHKFHALSCYVLPLGEAFFLKSRPHSY